MYAKTRFGFAGCSRARARRARRAIRLHAAEEARQFQIDLDVAKALDPFAHQGDSGSVQISYDLPRDFLEQPDFLPRSSAKVDPNK